MTKIRKEQKNWPLPTRQKSVVDFIIKFSMDKGYAPVESEIAEGLEISRSNVQTNLNRLMTKGWIKREPKHKHRNIKVVM